MGIVGTIYKYICNKSPRAEILLRKIYWNNVKYLKKFRPYNVSVSANKEKGEPIDFNTILNYLRQNGVGEGSLLIIHSSYDPLLNTGLKPGEIIEKLRDLVGVTGTIAMPAIRHFKEEPPAEELLKTNTDNLVCEYNVLRTPVSSGMLPFTLLRTKESICSHFPFNPLVAIGPLAKEMMKHNIDDELCSAHGKKSCWKFCLDHNATIIGLGVDLDHHNTMLHVMEEAFDNWYWSDEEWYQIRIFDLIDENKNKRRIKVRERKPEWGMIYNAEVRMYKAFYDDGIISKKFFGDIPVCIEQSQVLKEHLQKRNSKGYPYFKF